jgi:dolichol-phosphate mannosyltransferase
MSSSSNIEPYNLDNTADQPFLEAPAQGSATQGSPALGLGSPDLATSADLSLSIVVPTRNEAANVYALLERIQQATSQLRLEVIFVDDSSDNTPSVIQEASEHFPFPVRLIARPPERRNGLGKAVVEGLQAAQSEWVCVMDGDLQHPPEVIPQLLDHALNTDSGLVAASRLTKGGGTAGLSLRRKFISYGLAFVSSLVFPKRMRQITDPLTGFFIVRRNAISTERLQPEGFKILLEILVRSPQLSVSEVPFEFGKRHAGESKANSHEVVLLFRQMLRLYLGSQQHLARFITVGASGLVVNNLLLLLFAGEFRWHYLIAATFATQGSTLWNFSWTESWVFHDRVKQGQLVHRLVSFFFLNNAMLLLRGPMLVILVAKMHVHYLWANILSLMVIMLLRYLIADRLIWQSPKQTVKA